MKNKISPSMEVFLGRLSTLMLKDGFDVVIRVQDFGNGDELSVRGMKENGLHNVQTKNLFESEGIEKNPLDYAEMVFSQLRDKMYFLIEGYKKKAGGNG